jgi:4-amino-4-deoxy-L-arabinose transferase-like glycosyltransferase
LVNLTRLPIFNDESIYLDWGWRETHTPGYLYYSLYDSKQPLLMWFFGIFQQFLSNPLFAGRLVSVIAGIFTLLGIYYFCKKYFNQKTAVISSLFYVFIPIFSFYDRLALMESAVGAIGIWSAVLFVEFVNRHNLKNSILLGLILGIGFFIKSSAFVFTVVFVFFSFIFLFKHKRKTQFAVSIFIVLLTFVCVVALLLINPQFWSTLSKNSLYTLTLSELLGFPLGHWIANALGNLDITFFYLSPLIFITFFAGVLKIIKEKNKKPLILLLFLGVSFLISTLVTRIISDRYIVSFMPFACIFAGYFVYCILLRNKYTGFLLLFVLLLSSSVFTFAQITNPPLYLKTMAKLTKYSQLVYLEGVTSGYGINETVSFIKEQARGKPLFVGIAENTGNPESAMVVYFNKDKDIKTAYFDAKLIGIDISSYDCLSLGMPFIFVSRYNQQAGLSKFLVKIKTINNPYGGNYIGIYQTKKDCKGKYLKLEAKKNL